MNDSNLINYVYEVLLNSYGPQGWWPIINNETLLCEYHVNAPRDEKDSLEIALGAILAQNTQWYPNVVRAIQQLKLGRPFTNTELELLKTAESYKNNTSNNGKTIHNNSNVNKPFKILNVLKKIKKNNIIDINKISNIDLKQLALIIKPSGFYNQKAIKLKNFCSFLLEKHNGNLTSLLKNNNESIRTTLLRIKGIGNETADSILLYSGNKPFFVVDAYTKRIFNRLGFKEENYSKIQTLFIKNLKADKNIFQEYHALIVYLAKNICKKKPLCEKCRLNDRCDFFKKNSANKC